MQKQKLYILYILSASYVTHRDQSTHYAPGKRLFFFTVSPFLAEGEQVEQCGRQTCIKECVAFIQVIYDLLHVVRTGLVDTQLQKHLSCTANMSLFDMKDPDRSISPCV